MFNTCERNNTCTRPCAPDDILCAECRAEFKASRAPNRAERKEAKRLLPIGTEGIEACRAIVKGSTAQKINEVFVDSFSASLIVKVYDALNEKNRATLIARPVAQVAKICFALVK